MSSSQYPAGGEPGGPVGPGGSGQAPQGEAGRWRPLIAAVTALALAAAVAVLVAVLVSVRPPVPASLTTAQIAARVNPALVDITATLGYQHSISAGTGLVLARSGVVLTNNHVIEGATAITARDIGNGRTYRAVVAGYDEQHDLAVLRLRGASGLAAAALAAAPGTRVGDRVVALGNAGGTGGTPAAAPGRVTGLGQAVTATDESSGVTEQLTGLIRTSARVQPGYSGGPLVSAAGQIIGINTAGSAAGRAEPQSYAVPSDQAGPVAEQIRAGTPSATVHIGATAFLGVALLPRSTAAGAAVGQVVAGSPAARAGLVAGDVITSLGGQAITSAAGLRAVLVGRHPGERVTVGWTDLAGRAHRATLVLVSGPAG